MVQNDGNILDHASNVGYMTVHICPNSLNCALKMGQSYLNYALINLIKGYH